MCENSVKSAGIAIWGGEERGLHRSPAVFLPRQQQVEKLLELVAELREKLGQTQVIQASKPPSSDPAGSRAAGRGRGKKKSGRKRGRQQGHKGHYRKLMPPSEVDVVVDNYPSECENCWEKLPEKPDPLATRHQASAAALSGSTFGGIVIQLPCGNCDTCSLPNPTLKRQLIGEGGDRGVDLDFAAKWIKLNPPPKTR